MSETHWSGPEFSQEWTPQSNDRSNSDSEGERDEYGSLSVQQRGEVVEREADMATTRMQSREATIHARPGASRRQKAFNDVMDQLQLSADDIQHILRAENGDEVEQWRQGSNMPSAAREQLVKLLAFAEVLSEVFETTNDAREWLDYKSRYLRGLTPRDALRIGRIDRAAAALDASASGLVL